MIATNRKAPDAGGERAPNLKRHLGPIGLTAFGIGAIIGAGIFVLTGHVAASSAGPAVSLSFVFAAVACGFAGLCYAEMAAAVPVAGSAYTYTHATMGRLIAWVVGWDLILEYSLGATTVAIGWSGYVVSLLCDLGIKLPGTITQAPFNLPAMLIVAVTTGLLLRGIEETSRANGIMVAIKLAVVLLFIILGARYASTENWNGPFIPPNAGTFGKFGWSGILQGAGTVFFAFLGFDVVSSAAQEARNPQRDLPIGILGSLAICTVLYVAVSLVLTGLVDYRRLDVPDPIAVGIDAIGLRWLAPIIKLGIIAGLSTVILVLLFSQPRIFYAMARDGLLPASLGQVHSTTRTPHVATLLTGICATAAAGTMPIGVVGELVSIGTLLAFTVVSAGVLVLRITRPDLHRPFRTPAIWLTAPLGVATSMALMLSLPRDTWTRLVVWMATGLLIYAAYGRKAGTTSGSWTPDIEAGGAPAGS